MDMVVAGRYRLGEQLGSGGMGTVWRADDLLLGREVAVKEVTFPQGIAAADAEDLRERTRREARAAARLNHPNAVTVFDVVEEDGRPWLVMELVPASTLAQTVAAEGPLPVHRTAAVGLAVLGALQAAHRLGIVHRDVKPSNILLAPAMDGQPERVVLTDFGIATTTGEESLTGTGLLLGSPAYIAPERVRGHDPGPEADLWSLGATMFTAVEGRPPFDQAEPILTVSAVVRGEHAPYVRAGPLVPVLDGLLQKDPAVRLTAIRTRALLQPLVEPPPGAADPAADAKTVVLGRGTGRTAGLSGRTAVLQLDQVQRQLARPDPQHRPAATATATAAVRSAAPQRTAVPQRQAVPALPRPTRPAPARPGRRGQGAVVAVGLLALAVAAGGGWALLHPGSRHTTAGTASAPTSPRPAASGATSPGTAAGTGAGGATGAPAGGSGGSTAAGAGAGPSGRGTPAGTSGPSGGAGATGQVPAGWAPRPDPAGWVAAVPESYRAGTYRGFPQYRDAATGRTLRVSTGQGQPDAVGDRRSQARAFAARHPSYREIAIRPVRYKGYPAADWEFSYEGLHVLNRVVDIDGRGYSLFFQTREADFPAALPTVRSMFAAFAPAVS